MISCDITIKNGTMEVNWLDDPTRCCFAHEKKLLDQLEKQGIKIDKVTVFCKLNEECAEVNYPNPCPLIEKSLKLVEKMKNERNKSNLSL